MIFFFIKDVTMYEILHVYMWWCRNYCISLWGVVEIKGELVLLRSINLVKKPSLGFQRQPKLMGSPQTTSRVHRSYGIQRPTFISTVAFESHDRGLFADIRKCDRRQRFHSNSHTCQAQRNTTGSYALSVCTHAKLRKSDPHTCLFTRPQKHNLGLIETIWAC